MSKASQTHQDNLVSGLAKIGLVLRNEAWSRSGSRGITPTQGQILAFLASRPLEGTTVGEIGRALAVSAPTASEAISTLVEKRLVRKSVHPADTRSFIISLTAAGQKIARQHSEWPDELLRGLDTLSQDERGVMLRALMKILRNFEEQGRIPFGRMCVNCRFFRSDGGNKSKPFFCELLETPIGDIDLRLDCSEQQPVPPDQRASVLAAFVAASGS